MHLLITKVIEGVETIIAPTTAEKKAQRVKGTSSSSTNTQNIAYVSSNSIGNTNGAVNTAHDATTASTQATTVNSTTINNLSDVVICAFFLRNFMPPKPNLSFSSLEEFVNKPMVSEPTVKKHVVETSKAKDSEAKPKAVRKNNEQSTARFAGKRVIDSGCSRHVTGNMSYLTDFKDIDGGYVAFRGNPKGGKIIGRGTIKTGNLDFENVYFVRELEFNLFSVLQMCDKRNSVLFNDNKYIVLSPNFKLTDESHVLLKVPRKNNMYSVDLKNIAPKGGLTCLFAKATFDESKLWHRRLGHIVGTR
ncbi:hypothetical protein Tco_0788108 [Tanacetum coccineum]